MANQIDLGRLSSAVLTEVRTVLSRAETALEAVYGHPELWIRFPEPQFDENRKYVGRTGARRSSIPTWRR